LDVYAYAMRVWFDYGLMGLLVGILLLIMVLVPGISRMVNGSRRWLGVAGLYLQVAELVKLLMIVYVARFMVQYHHQIQHSLLGFIKPLMIISLISLLLLRQPDFGSVVVITVTSLVLLYLGGVPIRYFLAALLLTSIVFAILVMLAPYRLQRFTSFIDPWANPFAGGYQLTQSLIAFGRGGWFGLGLGESIQKLFYLPEAHTDFIFAVIAEELGAVGAMVLMGLYATVWWRSLSIGHQAHLLRQHFNGYMAQGIAIWFAVQTLISIGVNMGVLPTKGLTLPLVSYGGSSMMVYSVALALLLRIAQENRRELLW